MKATDFTSKPTPASVRYLVNKLLSKHNATLHSQFDKIAQPVVYFNKGKVKVVFGVGPVGLVKFNGEPIRIHEQPNPAQVKFTDELRSVLAELNLGSTTPIKWNLSNSGPFIVI